VDDLPAREQRPEPAADRLNLGKLGHASSLVAAGRQISAWRDADSIRTRGCGLEVGFWRHHEPMSVG